MTGPLALTTGDASGIGREITLKAWQGRVQYNMPPFFAIDDPEHIESCATHLSLPVSIASIESPQEALSVFQKALPVLPPDTTTTSNITLASIQQGARLAWQGSAGGLVTNPVRKSVFAQARLHHAGHTEYLAHYLGKLTCAQAPFPVMMLTCPDLKVIPVTRHIPLATVSTTLTATLLTKTVRAAAHGLRSDFGIHQPRFAVAGLNPHAGEDGDIGNEEQSIIIPAIKRLQSEEFDISGPFSADSLFHTNRQGGYDVILCMYHDQALIPIKTISFGRSVNVTLGLPIVRTSPDHGPAQDIAGQGRANPSSLIAALCLAGICVHTKRTRHAKQHP
ncbi:MAG: 4-hydroxythreonine-4-phosphate dehydrogenase PdxA [Parvularculales bacterium]